MPRRRNTLPVIAFSTSLLVHAVLLIALPYAIEAATPEAQRDVRNAAEPMKAMELPVEVKLGIVAETQDTPTWLGFAEPQPQQAERAEIEQAAFTAEPVAAAPPATMPTPAPSPEIPAARPQPEPQLAPLPNEVQHDVTAELTKRINPPPPAPEDLIGEITLGDNEQSNLDPAPQPMQEQPELFADAIEVVKELLRELQKAVEQQQASEARSQPTDSAAAPLSPPGAQPAPQIQPGMRAEQAPTEVGSPADRQSSPTSLFDVPPDQWQLGKPLAREGLTLKPRRPEFTLLTLLTASPGNPHVLIHFGRDGVPVTASLLRSSGDKRVDDAIVASLYRWRAEGKELENLTPGKTLDVRMRIILNRRAASAE